MEKRNDAASDYIWLLKVRNKALENRILSFENGHAYQLLLNYVNHVTLKKDSEVRAINSNGVTSSSGSEKIHQ